MSAPVVPFLLAGGDPGLPKRRAFKRWFERNRDALYDRRRISREAMTPEQHAELLASKRAAYRRMKAERPHVYARQIEATRVSRFMSKKRPVGKRLQAEGSK